MMIDKGSETMEMPISKGQFPELDNLESGSTAKMSSEVTVTWDGENGTLKFGNVSFETENQADYDMRKMRGQESAAMGEMESGDGDF